MVFKNNVDKKLEKLGFVKDIVTETENKYGVCYRREVSEFNYIQRLDILHKANGRHLIQSYQEGINSDGFNNFVGLTYEETKLAMRKYRQLKRKYRWK